MNSGCKMIRNGRNILVPVLPTGEHIPCITRDSIEFFQNDSERGAGLVRVKLQLFVLEKDIEGGFSVKK